MFNQGLRQGDVTGSIGRDRSDCVWKAPRRTLSTMELTNEQMAFLAALRTGAQRAAAALDASMIGPLIRANLVRWDDDPAAAAKLRDPPGTTFTLTNLGEQYLLEHEARCRLAE
jgi:hypothetical protein